MLEYDAIIDHIYEAAIVPDAWPKILDAVARYSGTEGGVLFAASPQPTPINGAALGPVLRWTSSEVLTDIFTAFLEEGWMEHNIRGQRGVQKDHAGFLTDHDLCTTEEIETNPFYRFVRAWGFGWCVGTTIQSPTGDNLIFDWERRLAEGPVPRETVDRLDPMRGHLARASLISSRLGLERARVATETLGLLGLPSAVLSPRHTLLDANDLFQDLMPAIVKDAAMGRIRLCDANADGLLTAALTQALSAGSSGVLGAAIALSIPMPARGVHPPMVVHVVPIRRSARDVFAAAASVVIVTPVVRANVPNAQVVQGLFDLTAAEARIARRISLGETIQTIAATTTTSEATIRHQLKGVFAKTGVARQADLISLLGRLDPVRPTDG